ncbi:MAG: GDP-L-fucose synthase [Desulfobacterales bacterium]
MSPPQNLSLKDRIFVAGHRGMVGSALLRRLACEGYENLLTRSRDELDLTDQKAVEEFFRFEKIDVVFLAAARVGGIMANVSYPAEFIYQNLMIECNVIHSAWRAGVERLLFLGSSCIYPRDCPQPMREEHLLSGPLEATNEPYAVAKIAGIKLCEAYNRQYGTRYRAVMPTNLYGPGDNFDLMNSHVLPAMVRKFHLGKLAMNGDREGIRRDEERYGTIPEDVRRLLPEVLLWGTGRARREFLHVEDMAAACVAVMKLSDDDYGRACRDGRVSFLNIGSGEDITIRELSKLVRQAVGYMREPLWDDSRPEGTPRKLLDVSGMERLGWKPTIGLAEGIRGTYAWYLAEGEHRTCR